MTKFFHHVARPAIALLLLAGVLATLDAHGGGLRRRSAAELDRAATELDGVAEGAGAEAAASEIDLARQWIEQGLAALRERRGGDAAVIAERLPVQLRLIRAIVAAAAVEEAATQAERETADLRGRLDLARARYDRLVLRREGARLSGAYPRAEQPR